MDKQNPPWQILHEKACQAGLDSYTDPSTGYKVFTKLYHIGRGYCCESGCRHCPYEKGAAVKTSSPDVKSKE